MLQTQRKPKKECHTSFDICKALIQTRFFSKKVANGKKLTPTARLVLQCLASHWNHRTGNAYPTQMTIAEETGSTKMSVIDSIEELRNAKLIITVKYKCRLNYQLTNVLLGYLNEPEESTAEVKNDIQDGKLSVTDSKQILPFYIKTNKTKQNIEKNDFHQSGLRGTNPVKPILEQYERDKQTAVSPFDDFDCAVEMLKRILKPETFRHAFARKMFKDIQAVWNLDDSVIEQLKKGETPDGKHGTYDS